MRLFSGHEAVVQDTNVPLGCAAILTVLPAARYITMDYADGGDLYAAINKQKGVNFPEEQVIDW